MRLSHVEETFCAARRINASSIEITKLTLDELERML